MKLLHLLFFVLFCLLFSKSEAFDDDISKLWKAFNEMKKELTETKKELADTKEELIDTRKELIETKKVVKTLKENCEMKDVLKKRVIPPTSDTHSIEQDIINLKAQVQSLTVPKVGFTAIMRHHVSNLGDNQVLVFDYVKTNEGGSYNSATGIFTCKESGLYLFYVNTLTHPGKHAETIIKKNSQAMVYTYALDKEAFSSGSNMAIMDLNIGDTVYVQVYGHEHDSSGLILDYQYTSFSGVLIHN